MGKIDVLYSARKKRIQVNLCSTGSDLPCCHIKLYKLLKCQILTVTEILKDEHGSKLYIDITLVLYTLPGMEMLFLNFNIRKFFECNGIRISLFLTI